MRSLTVAAFATLALAAPNSFFHGTPCLSTRAAAKVAQNFADLIGKPFSVTLAREALAPDYTDHTDSVIELIDSGCNSDPLTLGTPTFTNRTAFIDGQGAQKPIPFEILKLWNTCDTVIMWWRSSAPGFVQPEQMVTGVAVLETVASPPDVSRAGQPYQIATVYSEFNSGAWLYDIGNFTPKCDASAPPKSRRSVRLLDAEKGALLY